MKNNNEALLVIDVQNDFCSGGSLAVPDGDAVVPLINDLMEGSSHVILTQDWHPLGHNSFFTSHTGKKAFDMLDDNVLWPEHCIQGSRGAKFHPDLNVDKAELILRKGCDLEIDSYSAFIENDEITYTGLNAYLRERGINKIYIAGLATDYCVLYSAMDAKALGFDVVVIEKACRPVSPENIKRVWEAMHEAGIERA